MILSFLAPAVFALQAQVTIGSSSRQPDSTRLREATLEAVMEELRDDSSNARRPVRRIALTERHLATAFRDTTARTLLQRARQARMTQDTTLRSYEARAYERVSVGLGVQALGRERLAFRHEDAARIQWHRDRGAWVEVTGSRSVSPIVSGDADATMRAPVPWFPGSDNLWIGSGLARADVDDRELVHPLATGAEAYYTYATGDSVTMTLPDGHVLLLRELHIAAREPKWNVTVGSFWFDVRSAHLVRAVYRISTPMDIWAVSREESRRERTDTLPNGTPARPGRNDDGPPGWLRPLLSPMKADMSGVTIEYGLYDQRFWLPRAQTVEGHAQITFMRIPVTFEQRFRYESVNALDSIPPIPPSERSRVVALRDSLRSAGVDSLKRDSLVREARRVRAREIAAERAAACDRTGEYTSYRSRYNGALRLAVQVPCDSAKLANSPDLPASIYDSNDEQLGASERDVLMKALNFALQPGWGPQFPALSYGLAQTRYNRVEGLSTALVATSALGRGYHALLEVRGSFADRQLNGELALWRSNGRSTVRGAVYRRLQASDDWGNPLSFGASLASLLYARDEGAYYRARGAELTRAPTATGGFEWRVFAEQQWGDSIHSRWTLFGGGDDSRFIANPIAARVTVAGLGVRRRGQWGLNPDGFRAMSDVRFEAATGDSTYVRGLFDVTVSSGIGPVAAALGISGGASDGELPLQRSFRLGGVQTIRGQTALTAAGNTFWMTRGELGTRNPAVRTIVFGDLGWAGRREDFSRPGRPMAGAGFGWSFLDGLVRLDVARGLWPARQWRLDLRLDARF